MKESEVAQECLTLCNPMDYSLPASSIHVIFQARILEWVAISFSRRSSWSKIGRRTRDLQGGLPRHRQTLYHLSHQGSKRKWKVKVKSLSLVRLFATPWTLAYQTPQSMEFSRQEYWSGLPFPSPLSFLGCGYCLHCPKWLPWTSYHTHIPGSRTEKREREGWWPPTPLH